MKKTHMTKLAPGQLVTVMSVNTPEDRPLIGTSGSVDACQAGVYRVNVMGGSQRLFARRQLARRLK
jgi:hypothetical protein